MNILRIINPRELHTDSNDVLYGEWEESNECETGFIVGGALESLDNSDDYGVTNVQIVMTCS